LDDVNGGGTAAYNNIDAVTSKPDSNGGGVVVASGNESCVRRR
jgi:hypothetical protein